MKNFIFSIFSLLLLGCNNNNDDGNKSECYNTACTEEFKTIVVKIEDSGGNPISLDGFKVTNLENENDITREINDFEWEIIKQRGTYPLFGDEYSKDYQNKELEINFKGFIDNQEVVNSNYTVGADCCHVILIMGETDLIIN